MIRVSKTEMRNGNLEPEEQSGIHNTMMSHGLITIMFWNSRRCKENSEIQIWTI
jgi:hypothetical protein